MSNTTLSAKCPECGHVICGTFIDAFFCEPCDKTYSGKRKRTDSVIALNNPKDGCFDMPKIAQILREQKSTCDNQLITWLDKFIIAGDIISIVGQSELNRFVARIKIIKKQIQIIDGTLIQLR